MTASKIVYAFLGIGILVTLGIAGLGFYGAQLNRVTKLAAPQARGDQAFSDQEEKDLPTDFVEVGVLRFPSGNDQAPVLEYVGADKKATTTQLLFTVRSICTAPNGGILCAALSSLHSMSFGGKRTIIEGVYTEQGVEIRKLRSLEANERITMPLPGKIYVDWPKMVDALNACSVASVSENQTERTVKITFQAFPEAWEAIQPLSNSLSQALQTAEAKCGPIARTAR